jgi:FAD:protein FMN transferase
MASPCEILFDLKEAPLATWLGELAAEETHRIEQKFSRYRDDNIISTINHSTGRPVTIDEETADLLDFAADCHRLSNGRFDITSGVLRRLWHFDGGEKIPTRKQVKALLPLVGWNRLTWERPTLTLPAGMEIDLGGIGKEYAVDRVASLLAPRTEAAFLVNFGGDLRAVGRRRDGKPWEVGVERPGLEGQAALQINLMQGAVATSGDATRYLEAGGVRYPHILNPRTGWPVLQAPRSVSVLADTCTAAGLLATLAMLRGRDAEQFLDEQNEQGGQSWVVR